MQRRKHVAEPRAYPSLTFLQNHCRMGGEPQRSHVQRVNMPDLEVPKVCWTYSIGQKSDTGSQ